MKVCDKTCVFFFFPIINKYFLMAKRSLLSRCPSYVVCIYCGVWVFKTMESVLWLTSDVWELPPQKFVGRHIDVFVFTVRSKFLQNPTNRLNVCGGNQQADTNRIVPSASYHSKNGGNMKKKVDFVRMSLFPLKMCHPRCNNKDKIHQYTTLYYSKFKIATCFGCSRQPSSWCMFQKWKLCR